mmetsp:Transcript_12230/g.30109  ORF Transcript_12230/g.30109 Transcript_12230/m.30109 type:complete len:226 (-) Transcript_12230:47-724(-)
MCLARNQVAGPQVIDLTLRLNHPAFGEHRMKGLVVLFEEREARLQRSRHAGVRVRAAQSVHSADFVVGKRRSHASDVHCLLNPILAHVVLETLGRAVPPLRLFRDLGHEEISFPGAQEDHAVAVRLAEAEQVLEVGLLAEGCRDRIRVVVVRAEAGSSFQDNGPGVHVKRPARLRLAEEVRADLLAELAQHPLVGEVDVLLREHRDGDEVLGEPGPSLLGVAAGR